MEQMTSVDNSARAITEAHWNGWVLLQMKTETQQLSIEINVCKSEQFYMLLQPKQLLCMKNIKYKILNKKYTKTLISELILRKWIFKYCTLHPKTIKLTEWNDY